ncbi:MAG: tryptophan 2,3-dioxygenase [Ectothiorhodospiraceae bacterium]|nr:tryptophan 2,3-dioxygenase [Ectothiorhodospiraceae bacterium]
MDEKQVYYADYLELDTLLNCQHPLSGKHGTKPAHDETLFIIIHQTYELWFKQILHELDSVIEIFSREPIEEQEVGIAVSRMRRVHEIQKILVDQISVLETMTPLDFLDFRDELFPASGFQSFQFRLLENRLGLDPDLRHRYNNAKYHAYLSEEHKQRMIESESQPSLLDLVNRWLERTPFLDMSGYNFWDAYKQAVNAMLDRDRQHVIDNPHLSEKEKAAELDQLEGTRSSFFYLFDKKLYDELVEKKEKRLSHTATQAALLILMYRDEPILRQPYMALECFMTIDKYFTMWRYRHVEMVHRMLGTKIGTGGSSGHDYLKTTAASHKVFTDLFDLSTYLIPRSELPALPAEIKKRLGFTHGS